MKGILANSISFKYPNGTEAIKKLSLYIKPGEVVGIMGRNGAGKSTFMKLINGLLIPTEGSVFVDGITTANYKTSELTRKVGVMFQNPEHQLFSGTVEDEIDFSLKNLGLIETDFNKYKKDIIEQLSLKHLLGKSPFNLSGGERKRVSIASILCRKPDYLLFDEPTVGADKRQRKVLQKIIERERKSGNRKTVILITHDTEFAYSIVDRIIVFERGRVLADGPTEKILSNDNILERSSLVEPQINKLMAEISKVWENKHKKVTPPINFNEIKHFKNLKQKLLNILEGEN
ncbi:MAG: energy-coupling factor ABC transporter ATP-binding protein [Promethearchaeota archaeon]